MAANGRCAAIITRSRSDHAATLTLFDGAVTIQGASYFGGSEPFSPRIRVTLGTRLFTGCDQP
jgi:hypothetical protein